MEDFFKNNIWGLLILGAIGSVIGYLLIALFNFLKLKFISLNNKYSEKKRNRDWENYRKQFIEFEVEYKILESNDSSKVLVVTKMLFKLLLNITALIIISVFFTQLLLNQSSFGSGSRFISFALGMLGALPSYKIGYTIGQFEAIYEEFIDRELKSLDIAEIEQRAKKIYDDEKRK